MFHIVQPCANGPRRFEHATVVSSHRTIDDAFDELEGVRGILGTHGLTALASELAVVTDDRSPIASRTQTAVATPATAATPERRQSNRNGRGNRNGRWKKNGIEIRTPPTEGWDFTAPALERVAVVPNKAGRLEVWRLEPDGAFSRMSAVEEDLERLPRLAIATPAVMPEPPAPPPDPPSVATSRARARSAWSDYHVRIRWPKTIGPVLGGSRQTARERRDA